MKHLSLRLQSLSLALLAASASTLSVGCAADAQADTDATESDVSSSARVVAKLESSGGFVPNYLALEVFSDGTVTRVQSFNRAPETRDQVARLAPETVKVLVTSSAALADSPLVASDPSAPPCLDAPSTTIRVRNASGAFVAVAGSSSCRELVRADHAYSPAAVLIDSLASIGLDETTTTAAAPVIAELTSGGGFILSKMSIVIKADGTVTESTSFNRAPATTTKLARLSPALVRAIRNGASRLTATELVQADPSSVGCFDAPGTTVRVADASGALVNLVGSSRCIELVRADGQQFSAVAELLNGFAAVASQR